MSNFWKWILGIVIILLVLFSLMIGTRFLMAGFFPREAGEVVVGFRHPMMTGQGLSPYGGMMPCGGGFMNTGWLFPLLLVGLLAYGAYRLGMRHSPPATPPAPPLEPPQVRTCPRCGNQIQAVWNHCAHCGKKLT